MYVSNQMVVKIYIDVLLVFLKGTFIDLVFAFAFHCCFGFSNVGGHCINDFGLLRFNSGVIKFFGNFSDESGKYSFMSTRMLRFHLMPTIFGQTPLFPFKPSMSP